MEDDEFNDPFYDPFNDPFADISEQCHISSSQEEILCRSPFVGQIVNLPHHEPSSSSGIITTSLTAETHQDVFHAPPRQSSLPISQQSEYAGARELVNLSDDSKLVLGQVPLKQRIDYESAVESSRGLDRDDAYEISKSEFNKSLFSKRKLLGKRVQISEQNPRFDSSRAFETERLPCKLANEVAESSGVSLIRECMENKAKGKGNGLYFTALRALIPKSEGESLDYVTCTWLQLAEARGVHFPRPRWKG